MKALIFLVFVLFMGIQVDAAPSCSSFFHTPKLHNKRSILETETQGGKPRYYSVRNYTHHKKSELYTYLKNIKNLTQFSEKLYEINTYMPDRGSLPSEAFFVANSIIPLIETFLTTHEVSYRIETFERTDDSRIRRTILIISEDGKNNLNELAKELGKQKILLAVDPIELFYGYEHYNQSRGKFFDMDAYTPSYAMSFFLLLHSQRKEFNIHNIARTDGELQKILIEMKIDSILAGPQTSEAQAAQLEYEGSFKESRQRAKKHIDELIKKGQSLQKTKGSLH